MEQLHLIDEIEQFLAESKESANAIGVKTGIDPGIVLRYRKGERDVKNMPLHIATRIYPEVEKWQKERRNGGKENNGT